MKDKIGFIINPKSGIFNKKRVPRLIAQYLDKEKFDYEIIFTDYPGHAIELSKNFADRGFKSVVAVGGDGTVNEVASGLLESDTAIGIIPSGSGNGMARHLEIPIATIAAIKLLNRAKTLKIDYGLINNQPFFCTCGVGFDAYISQEFKNLNKRGLVGYIRKTVSSYMKFKPQKCSITDRGKVRNFTAFDIIVANASQWGNNAYIAPQASVRDKKFDIVVIKGLAFLNAIDMGVKLFTKNLKNTSYMKSWKSQEIVIKSETKLMAHFDGEPFEAANEFKISIVPEGINVFCLDKFQ